MTTVNRINNLERKIAQVMKGKNNNGWPRVIFRLPDNGRGDATPGPGIQLYHLKERPADDDKR